MFVATDNNAEERMEQSAVEFLLQFLPNDLSDYVSEDNKAFEEERAKWDRDQEEKKRQEAMKMEEKVIDSTSNEVQVIFLKKNNIFSNFFVMFRFGRLLRKNSRTSTLMLT